MLKDYRILPKSTAKQLVVLLHGVGADGKDLLDLGGMWQTVLPDAAFISADAPQPYDMAPFGRQWFSLSDRTPSVMEAGLRHTLPVIDAYLDSLLKEFSLPASKLALVGFSQGTMMSLFLAPRRREQLAGVLAYSGAMLAPETLTSQATSKPPICLIHGLVDDVVPAAASRLAQQVSEKHDFPSELHLRDHLGHGIDDEGLKIGAAFLQRILS